MTPRMADPFSGAPDRIEPIAPDTVRVCTDFELPPDDRNQGRDHAGCLVRQFDTD